MSNGRSQETLDSVGLQTPSEAGTSVHEGETVEGNYFDRETHKKVVVGNLYDYLVHVIFTIFMAIHMLQNSSIISQ